jgi:magnesium-transporting ATPase (P-type)
MLIIIDSSQYVLSPAQYFFPGLITYSILFYNYIPIYLFIGIDVSRIIQGYIVQMDPYMVYNGTLKFLISGKGCNIKTFSLLDDLGRVKFLLSDKTGKNNLIND